MTTLKYDIQPIEYNDEIVEAMIISKTELQKIFSKSIIAEAEINFIEGKSCGKSMYMLQSLNMLLKGTEYELDTLLHFQPNDNTTIIRAINKNVGVKNGKVVMN